MKIGRACGAGAGARRGHFDGRALRRPGTAKVRAAAGARVWMRLCDAGKGSDRRPGIGPRQRGRGRKRDAGMRCRSARRATGACSAPVRPSRVASACAGTPSSGRAASRPSAGGSGRLVRPGRPRPRPPHSRPGPLLPGGAGAGLRGQSPGAARPRRQSPRPAGPWMPGSAGPRAAGS